MASEESAPQLLFRENSKEEFLAASELLLRLANNVLENPDDVKYRRIRISNPLLESKLLPVIGGMECLFEMGFIEDGEHLTLPASSSLRVLRQVRNDISNLCKSAESGANHQSVQAAVGSGEEPIANTFHGANSNVHQETDIPAAALGTLSAPFSEATSTGARPKSTAATPASQRSPARSEPAAAARSGPSVATAKSEPAATARSEASVAVPRSEPSAAAASASPRNLPARPQGDVASARPQPAAPSVQARPTQTLEDMRKREGDFARRIQQTMAHVLMYEDPNLQEKARGIIPVAQLTLEARARLDSPEQPFRHTPGSGPPDVRDCLLLELLGWFKKSFFRWVDSLPCESCGGSTHHAGSVGPTPEELLWGGSRVESHKCNSCGAVTRFPRYNHPGKLLDTRRGRCGEWANCFTLCCRALGYEARYVLDWTDHVWTEVHSESQKRWLHCDPCENTCDKPLLYESGWGKKLTYVIAFSKDELQDVTWRYSAKHAEVLARRRECRETWLVSFTHTVFKRSIDTMQEARQAVMRQRLLVELVEFMTVKSHSEGGGSLGGRTTGSLAWRQGRGEMGGATAASCTTTTATSSSPRPRLEHSFKLLQEEKHSEVVHLKYSCAKDQYVRASAHDISTGKWFSCSNSRGVFRKEESDWKMSYLARDEQAETGEISWKFDLTEEDLRINKLEIKASSAVYENGVVDWKICSDDLCFPVPGSQLADFKTFELDGGHVLTITATLSKGTGDVAWQHAQLFRQHLDDSCFPFEVILHLG